MIPREQTAERLLQVSLRNQYDPLIDIDWDAPLDPDRFWIPPTRSSLYGTSLWDGLTHAQRVELTKHEVTSAASAGLWFETILMEMLIRFYYDADPTTQHAQYALTEVADECRHSIMFGRLISRAGTPVYPPSKVDHALGKFLKATATGPHMYAAILIAEEILDAFQREIMSDETLQPLIRMVSRVHVIEEARHIKFAREELVRQVEAAGPVRLAYSRVVIARAAYSVATRLVHPQAYEAVGIPAAVGSKAARANPHFRSTLKWAASRITPTLLELGLIGGPSRLLWTRAGLL
ncbi:AurF N-oxygenase family protein [Catelliglobosispora koreensis]|uniref:AurF N-oxygenase family protein n=1 Tax=Catelliglobosispora koreensis TaxID=129052 RepID=UPI00038169AE|nr:diiron oxygenase [Catelliglobosispora koreensis]